MSDHSTNDGELGPPGADSRLRSGKDGREERRWAAALAEHVEALRAFVAACERMPPDRWHQATAPGKWSPSEVVLHVTRAYDLARDAAGGRPGMRLRVTPLRAWALRTFLLPLLLQWKRLPAGVPAPREVVPDATASGQLGPRGALEALLGTAQQAAASLRRSADQRPVPRLTHAYFGPLAPCVALRMLTTHTWHHARALARLNSVSAREGSV